MVKNMFRKSLATAAAGALSVAGFAAPADAAINSITVAPIAGTSTNGLLGASYVFTVATPGTTTGDKVTVLFDGIDIADVNNLKVEGAADISAEGGFDFTSAEAIIASSSVDTTDTDGSHVADLNPTGGTGVRAKDNANGDLYVQGITTAGSYLVFTLSLDTSVVTAATDVAISVFQEDGTADGVYNPALEAGKTSSVMTVSFLDPADVSATLSVTDAAIGAKTADVAVAANGVNNAAIAKDATDLFDVKTTFLGATTSLKVNTWSADDEVFAAAAGTVVASNFTASANYYSKVYILGETTAAGTYNSTTTAGQDDVDAITADSLDVALQPYLDAVSDTDNTSNSAKVRSGSGSFDVTVEVVDATPEAVSGATVTWVIEEGANDGLDADARVNGLANSSTTTKQKVSVDSLTDADGEAVLTVSYSGLDNGDSFTVVATTIKSDGTLLTSDDKWTITAEDSAAAVIVSNPAFDGDYKAVTKGGSASVSYSLADQYGMVPEGTFRATWLVTGGNTLVDQSAVISGITDGSFTVSWTDNSTAASDAATLQITKLEKYAAATDTWADLSKTSTALKLAVTAAAQVPATVSVAAVSGTKALNLADITVQDERVKTNATANTALAQTTTATVYDADGLVVKGYPVTFAAAGVQFSDADKKVYAMDSITVYTDNTGVATIFFETNIAGSHVVTATAGSASDSATVKFAQAKDDTGYAWEVTAPATVTPGSTFTVTATLKDKYGNIVVTDSAATNFNDGTDAPTVSVSYDGPGINVGTTPTKTDNTGSLKFAVIVGTNDSGTGTVTVTFDTDGASFVAVSSAVTFTIGTAGNTGAYSSWTKKLDDNSAKMYAKNVVGEGKVQFFLNGEEIAWVRAVDATDPKLRTANGSAYLVRTVEFEDGKNVLEIYVDGVRTTRTAYTK